MSTWQKQRDQIMAWVTEHVSELQAIPTEMEALTEALIEAELFTVDVAGALALGPWPVEAGTWATRKVVEAEKFGVILEWARAILALRVPVLASAAPGAVAGGAGASSSGGVAPSGALTAPTAAAGGGSIAGAPAGGGSGGGVPAGAAGAHGVLGVGTVASAAATPSAGAHVMDPQSIAAAIATPVGVKLDALGERLAMLEAQRLAAGGAPAVLSGTEPVEAVELRCAIRDSVATVEGWDVPRCLQACADLVHEAAKLPPQLTALRTVHPFGKTPMRTLEAHAFEPLAYILPELRAEECELDELPPGSEATVEHWHAFVHLLQARVGEFQRFVKSQVPTFPISDVMVASFFKKRKRVTFEGEEEEARAAGGGHGSLPPLDAAHRDRLATLGAGFRTVNEEQLARALRGELAPEDVVRPPGAGPPLTAVPRRGPLAGIDLIVSPVPRLQQEDEGRLKLKDGELTMVAKKKKCKDFSEWERGFLRILCEASAEARYDLMDFVEWARTIAEEFSFYHFNEFYKHLVRQELPRPTIPEDAGGGKGKGKGAGGREGRGGRGGGRGGRGGISDVCYGHNEGNLVAVPLGEPRSSSEAPAGADGVPVAAPDLMVEADAEPEFGQPIAVENIGAVDAQARGIPTVGYLDDFFCVLETKEQAEEAMMLLVEFATFQGFNVNRGVCTASIDEERIAVVQKAGDLRAQAARGMVAWRRLESLLGQLAFCSHVVWASPLHEEGLQFSGSHDGQEDAPFRHGRLRARWGSGVWERLFFMLSWEDLARMSGTTVVVVRINNQSAMYQEFGPFTVDSYVGLEGWAEELVQELQREAERYRAEALTPETRRCYGTGVRAFVTFCITFACVGCLEPLLPATDRTLCMFITYCSWFVQPDTIKNYLAGVRQLHLQRGHEWVPVAARHAVAATLQGVKRCWGRPPRPVMPLTLSDLAKMAALISSHVLGQEALWAAILVGFFGLFRKDNLTTGKAGAWNTRGALVRDDVLFHEDGSVVWIRVRHSKTIQCGERHHWVPLRAVPGSLLCPVRALMRLMERTAGRPGDSALFVMEKVTGRLATVVPMTHDALVTGIKSLAERVGLDPSSYAGHSLRRGGVTAAMRLDVASIYIKMQGDWKSGCFERYCELDTEQKVILPGAMAEAAAAADR
ncbi:hypothetical protein CYMTET_21257 [Cymbomonas tetramitiformis]|uniref:Tyr recombinase domain-containing protein n=1 Tax=Cymbomonas tetramitiformis TaxID=36881 RepID=A0AAE0G3P8_9CHLO|nr:hypothetical protein CYMTET_21257 [Cymbomonas tetramitiformis]